MELEKKELFEPVLTHKVSYFLERLITCKENAVLLILDNVLLIADLYALRLLDTDIKHLFDF